MPVDDTAPSIRCPTSLYRHHYNSDNSQVPVVYPDGLVNATDYGGIASIVFEPAAGVMVEVLKETSVTATAFDWSGNSASCSFLYMADSKHAEMSVSLVQCVFALCLPGPSFPFFLSYCGFSNRKEHLLLFSPGSL